MLPGNHLDRIQIAFDDHRLVANAGLILPATLALRLGLPQLLRKHLDLGGAPGRANTDDKMMTLVASALDQPIPPFPGDRPAPTKSSGRRGRSLFDSIQEVDLADYASQFTRLRTAGPGKWKGLCPLHNEKTPSFYVYSDAWRWRCYGACATGGDIVTLAKELRNKGKRQ